MTARSTCQPTLKESKEKGNQKIMFVAKETKGKTHTHTQKKKLKIYNRSSAEKNVTNKQRHE